MGTYRANTNVLGYAPGDVFTANADDVKGYLEGGHVEPVDDDPPKPHAATHKRA